MSAPKRVLFISDTHCGHVSGLTPPRWWWQEERSPVWAGLQRRAWHTYTRWVEELGELYAVLYVGDGMDGTGWRSGGSELVEPKMLKQVEMAVECLRVPDPTNGFSFVRGTPYHVRTEDTDYEDQIAKEFAAEIHNHATVDIGGVLFDLRHKIGNTSTPTGGDIALRKEMLWAKEWGFEHGFPVPHQLVRGHVHRWRQVVDGKMVCTTLPSLQLWTDFGSRMCSGLIHWGLAWADIHDDGSVRWDKRLLNLADYSETATVTL